MSAFGNQILKGKVAFVAGGTRGMNLAIARRYAEQGADVAVLSRDAGRCAAAEAGLRELGVRALGLPVVSTAESASALFPGAQVVPTPWAALPSLFATTDLLRAEAKPEALNPAATYATWDGERHRGPA